MTQLLAERGAEVWNCDWRGLLDRARELGGVDSLIVDAPYSERTHVAYRDMAEVGRRSLAYASWDSCDVAAFVEAWSPIVRGWIVSLTDHSLAASWESALSSAGRYVFAPLACMEPGSRVRLSGDGPCQWSVWAVVARPKTREAQQWGALPGGYIVGAADGWRGNNNGRSGVIGGKPLALMRALVRDYTRPGDLVCDPCCGAGTTGLAAIMEGRRALLGDAMEEHARLAVERLRAMPGETKAGQLALLGGGR